MTALRYYLDTASNGSNTDWTVNYASSGWEAVSRGSGDTTYVSSGTLGQVSDFLCGDAPYPSLGIIAGITVKIRAKVTDTAGAPDLAYGLFRSSSSIGSDTFTPTNTDWTVLELRVRDDTLTGVRFAPSGVQNLGVGFEVTTAPTSGVFQISEVWLEVEWIQSDEYYDPYGAATPDAVLGALAWSTSGTQSGSLSSNQLRINDTSNADFRRYFRTYFEFSDNIITDISIRLFTSTALAGPAFVFRIMRISDGTKDVDLCAFLDSGGNAYIGLSGGSLDRDDPTKYLATYALDWTSSHHYRIVVDRDPDPGVSTNVRVFVDYDDTPVMDVSYFTFPSGVAQQLEFGSGDVTYPAATSDTRIDFVDWWTYHKGGPIFPGWHDYYTGNQNRAIANTADPYIVKPIQLYQPPMLVGQSETCCQINIVDNTKDAWVKTYWEVPSALGTYDLTLDYRMDLLAAYALLVVQRTSDHYYWNNGGAAFQAAVSAVTIPNSMLRTRATLMSAIQTATPDKLVITIATSKLIGAPHSIYLYKADLRD